MNKLSSQFALVYPSQSIHSERSESDKVPIGSRQNTSVAALPGIDPVHELEPISNDKLEKTVRQMNDHIQQINNELHISIDEESGQTMIKVIDAETLKTIRQFRSEEPLNLARYMADREPLGFCEASA